jgi:hypothetical protein
VVNLKRSGWSGWIRSLREFGGEVRKAWWTLVVSVLAVAALLILIFPHLAIPPAFAVAALVAAAEIASFVAFHNLRVSHAKQLATLRADQDAAIESAKHSHPISPAHQDAHLGEIQQIALDLKSGLPDTLSFGVDATRKRHKLTCHSADTRESIENWEPVHNEWLDARSAVDQRARQVEESLNLDDGFWKVLKIVAWKRATDNRPGSMEAPINGRSEGRDGTIWAPIPFSKDPPILVAHYRDDADRDAKLAGMQAAVDGTQNWEETRRWNQADREQEAVRSKLRNALGDVINQHVLRGHCDYC